jgi:hypothetical protein
MVSSLSCRVTSWLFIYHPKEIFDLCRTAVLGFDVVHLCMCFIFFLKEFIIGMSFIFVRQCDRVRIKDLCLEKIDSPICKLLNW